jgi:hypothetical protein
MNSITLLRQTVEILNMIPNTRVMNTSTYELISKIEKHLNEEDSKSNKRVTYQQSAAK